jgi:hypothetical protein
MEAGDIQNRKHSYSSEDEKLRDENLNPNAGVA